MNLWTLERLRLTRTNRGVILLGAYLFFAITGPLTARYLNEILGAVGGGIEVVLPDPTAADGITQFTSNAGQLGILAVVVVAAAALAIDADRERAMFLRTRVRSGWTLILPRVVVPTVAATVALVIGTIVAAVLAVALLGDLDIGGLVVGTVYGALYLAFVVALTAAVATFTKSVISTVLSTVAALLALPVLSLIPAITRWVPSELLGAVDGLIRGAPATEAAPAAVVGVVLTVALVALAAHRTERREL